MITVHSVAELREHVRAWRMAGLRIGFVATMGNLHEGHLALVREANKIADRVIVSIFVNPLQFGEGEDFDSYPRTLDADSRALADVDTDLVFAPSVNEMYPRPQADQTKVEVPGLSDILCGATRPGHFVGVATVVCKLFNQVQPDLAVFGDKDYQQVRVIARMVEDLAMPVEVVPIPTVREADGLAMSSRNGYLTESERAIAPTLYRVLNDSAEALRSGRTDYGQMELEASAALIEAGLRTDYVSIRGAGDLASPEPAQRELVILAAAFLGRARLIDNLVVQLD